MTRYDQVLAELRELRIQVQMRRLRRLATNTAVFMVEGQIDRLEELIVGPDSFLGVPQNSQKRLKRVHR